MVSSTIIGRAVPQTGIFFKHNITLTLWSTRRRFVTNALISGYPGLISDMKEAVDDGMSCQHTSLFCGWLTSTAVAGPVAAASASAGN